MADAHKICPVCETHNPPHAAFCTACGTHIAAVLPVDDDGSPNRDSRKYDFRQGETDLYEQSLASTARTYLVVGVTFVLVIIFVGIGLFLTGLPFLEEPAESAPSAITTPQPQPTLDFATVTQGPPTATASSTPSLTPTATITPTRGPCTITMPQGQSLIWALGQCGHQSLDVLPEVLDLNNLADAASVRANQQILIPWPTPTEDPNAEPTEPPTAEGGADADDMGLDGEFASLDESIEAFAATATPTLPPGVMWHEIQPQENIISVAVLYNTDVQTLSQLNRQVDFARCDFGMTYGGPECIVQLFQGQMLRVPAPTPTPTLSPTPDPNATATPTPTATFNRPSALSPSDREFFYADQLVTLRWIPSATLREGEAYRVDVTDTTNGTIYTALTTDIRFIIPADWQGMDEQRHVYEWQVSVVSQENPDEIRYQTDPKTFVWQGLTEESE